VRRLTVTNNLTLDGVTQAPARADEDVRDGFAHGGWAMAFNDEVKGRVMGEAMASASDLLLGRRTYQDFAAVWPQRTDNPFTDVLNHTRKYVASTTLGTELPWQNSTLLTGDAADAVAALKTRPGNDLVVLGSGDLVQSLRRRDLVDSYVLLIHPLVLGSGRRLFPEGCPPAALRLVASVSTPSGVVITTYERD
jgi:dihydrofolate reductase